MLDTLSRSDNKSRALAELILIGEIVNKAKIADKVARYLEYAASVSDPVKSWGAIQSILKAAANISKILWPSRKNSASRGDSLRNLLGINERNLLQGRSIRNHFENCDERIEDGLEDAGSSVYFDSKIDSLESVWRAIPTSAHRRFDPVAMSLSFRGESTNLAAMLGALEEIRCKCRHLAIP